MVYPPRLFLRVFKLEQKLELWAKGEEEYVLIKTYHIPAHNTQLLGPKRKRGDLHIPEGFYVLSGWNPHSWFHLSIQVSYPNELDRILGSRNNLGGSIFIHGGTASLGCIPITNEGIEEVYLSTLKAHQAGQRQIPIHIFPAQKLMAKNMLEVVPADFDANLIGFWKNLREGYQFFEKYKYPPLIEIQGTKYVFQTK